MLMSNVIARGGVESVTVEAVVTRADGTVEDLGVIAYNHRSRLRRLWFKLTGKVA